MSLSRFSRIMGYDLNSLTVNRLVYHHKDIFMCRAIFMCFERTTPTLVHQLKHSSQTVRPEIKMNYLCRADSVVIRG